jgi:predicted dehydrogenase
MKIAVVGCGYWGAKHVRVLSGLEAVTHVVAVDTREDRRDALAAIYPNSIALPDLESALPLVDAVVVATPPASHFRVGMRALEAGKHVLIEKPMTTSVEDAARLVEYAELTDLVLMVGHTFEYNPAVWKLRELVQNGDLGRVHYIDSARRSLGLYQQDINVLWDLAPHDVSILNFILGQEPDQVGAWGSSHAHPTQEDIAYLRLEYGGLDTTSYIHVSWLDPAKVRRVTVVGSERMAVYNDLSADERVRIYDRGVVHTPEDLSAPPAEYRYGDIVSPYIHFREPLVIQGEHFVNCIIDGTTPATDGRNGLAVVAALEAASRALRNGELADVTEFPQAIDAAHAVALSARGELSA